MDSKKELGLNFIGSSKSTVADWEVHYMSKGPRVDALIAKHKALDSALARESTRPDPDDIRIAVLKKEKLRIKDEIAHLQHA
jgi:hypothetical protein